MQHASLPCSEFEKYNFIGSVVLILLYKVVRWRLSNIYEFINELINQANDGKNINNYYYYRKKLSKNHKCHITMYNLIKDHGNKKIYVC